VRAGISAGVWGPWAKDAPRDLAYECRINAVTVVNHRLLRARNAFGVTRRSPTPARGQGADIRLGARRQPTELMSLAVALDTGDYGSRKQ